MAEIAASPGTGCQIRGPDKLVLRRSSSRGPFAGGAMLPVRLRFSVANAATEPRTIKTCTIDPLRRAASGADMGATLTVGPIEPRSLAPGESLELELAGEIPARAGTYASTVRLQPDSGAALEIPLSVEVPAVPAWGVAAMLFGLICLGVIDLLAGEGAVKGQLHDALAARQEVHAWLEGNPTPQSRAGDVEAMDRAFDQAIVTLGARRRASVVDHRAGEGAAALKTATDLAARLRHDLAGKPRGAGEIADLDADWQDLQGVLRQVGAAPAVGSPSPGLAGKLDAFLIGYRRRFLQQPVGWIGDEAASELDRVRLDYAAGEGEAARDLALTTRQWLRRSARTLDTALVGYRGGVVLAGAMVNNDAAIRARIARSGFPAVAGAQIQATLDAAAATLDGDAWLPQFAAAHKQIDDAETALVRATTAAAKAAFDQAIADADTATSSADIDAYMDQAQASPDRSPADKRAVLGHVLDLWRTHLTTVTDTPTQAKLQAEVDRLAPIVANGDLNQVGAPYRQFLNDWAAWNGLLVTQARDRIDHQQCLDLFADLQRDTGAIEASLRERPPGPALDGWDRRLDQLRLDMQRRGPDAETVSTDCMIPLLAMNQQALQLSGEILTANIVDLGVPALTRIRLARSSGLADALAATQANAERPRALALALNTPLDERVVGRDLAFIVQGADPVWGSGVGIAIDFADGSPPFERNAEVLRQNPTITHAYANPLTAHVAVAAATAFKPGGLDPMADALGQGTVTVLVAPSPVSAATALADAFLNLRFAIALLIALVVYYWRFQNKTAVFGARGFDYVEAFALGFAANAAVAALPDVLAKFGAAGL